MLFGCKQRSIKIQTAMTMLWMMKVEKAIGTVIIFVEKTHTHTYVCTICIWKSNIPLS